MLVLVALVVGRVVTDQLPDPRAIGNRPFEQVVTVGETAHLRVGDVTVTSIEGGKSWADVAQAKLSPGLWLVATLTFVPAGPDSAITYVAVRDDTGATWERGRGVSTCNSGIAGVPLTCQVTVEVPEREMPGAQLVLRMNSSDLRWDDQAVIGVTLDKQTVKEWGANTTPIKVSESTMGSP